MGAQFTYKRAAELPGLYLPWQYQTGPATWADLDLGGYTLSCTLTNQVTGVVTVPAATLTGSLGGVAITWATNDLDLPPGMYRVKVRAVETATSKDRWWSPDAWPVVRIVD
jgi:hypothetical protein